MTQRTVMTWIGAALKANNFIGVYYVDVRTYAHYLHEPSTDDDSALVFHAENAFWNTHTRLNSPEFLAHVSTRRTQTRRTLRDRKRHRCR